MSLLGTERGPHSVCALVRAHPVRRGSHCGVVQGPRSGSPLRMFEFGHFVLWDMGFIVGPPFKSLSVVERCPAPSPKLEMVVWV